jgi:DNA-binding phage protein
MQLTSSISHVSMSLITLTRYVRAEHARFISLQASGGRIKDVDWFAIALRKAAGDVPDDEFDLGEVAKKLGVSRSTLYNWDKNGLANAKFGTIVRLSQLSNIELTKLSNRLGPAAMHPVIKMERRRASKNPINK